MTPEVKKQKSTPSPLASERGQLSIFLGIIMLIIFSMIAFIVNVGLFVKAKINLQNAVDAAAYAGAATQARQMTNIGFLNWELRNTFKEWMFKYYVLGQMGLPNTRGFPIATTDQGSMNFTLKQFAPGGSLTLTEANDYDRYNVPSICIHFGQFNHNICEIYDVPGLPRFPAPGLPNIQEAHEEFLKNITSTKAKDCSVRSNVNFATALQWAYGTKSQIIDEATLIASTRMGAWPQALELGMRMRNLEYILNVPPHPAPICYNGSGCDGVESITVNDTDPILNAMGERKAKAFWSAYRSLGGGEEKDSRREIAYNFKMTELKPEPFTAEENTVSSFLIPSDKNFPTTGEPVTTKYYIDLQAYPINFGTFYTSFVTKNSTLDGSIQVEGTCAGTKTALPVPGYLLGFVKNPEVMTYYAVRGESKYIGMFYPFVDKEGFKIEAYAAAKPFGGRIGPRLFTFNDTQSGVKARDDSDNKISSPYVAGINSNIPGYKPGYPLPASNTFWVSSPDDVIGGVPSNNASGAKFVMPNMIYDAWPGQVQSDLNAQKDANVTKILVVEERTAGASTFNANEKVGLYNPQQFLSLRANLPEGLGASTMSGEQVHRSLESTRRPTNYEVLNYMIPTFEENPASNQNQQTPPSISLRDLTGGSGAGGTRTYALFAPLFGANALYTSVPEIEKVVQDYINNNSTAINSFVEALKSVSDSIRASAADSESGDSSIYAEAADTIYKFGDPVINESAGCDKVSMTAKFHHFFTANAARCGIVPLKDLMVEYINKSQTDDTSTTYNYDNFYKSTFFAGYEFNNSEVGGLTGPDNLEASTGYVPGPRQNGSSEGLEVGSIGGGVTERSLKRNFYSTKFFAIEKVLDSGDHPYGDPMIFMERTGLQEWPDFTGIDIVNKLPASLLQGFYGPDH